ncbi:hypothetical protein AGMMS49992_34320 [Clostridia bacterium]|nr:hypothetical protein AGMMS49992_34320 [Clostridia bacterium]
MKTTKIVFTSVGKAELMKFDVPPVGENSVLVEMEYTAISAGTERANLTNMPNIGDSISGTPFPKILGYSGAS